jgi:hypothetical protein
MGEVKMSRKKLEPNVIVIDGDLVYIHLSGKRGMGKISIVDLWSFKKHNIAAYTWRCTRDYYVYTLVDEKVLYLHRLVSGNETRLHTDHIAGSEGEKSLDNRRENLRICTNRENQLNGKIRIDNETGYKNVNILNGKYRCMIRINGGREYFGMFEKPSMAALCYNISIPHFSDVYQLNVIPEGSLTEEEIELVHNTVENRLEKIHNKRQIVVNPDFNRWTDKVKSKSV